MAKRYTDLQDPSQIVAARRQELALNQAELAKALGYQKSNFISVLESGKSKVPLDMAPLFAHVLEMDQKWFVAKCMRSSLPNLAEFLFGPDKAADQYWISKKVEAVRSVAS